MKWEAFKTHHRRQSRLARLRGSALHKIARGLRFEETSSGSQVFYCAACKGPVVNSPEARARHARRGGQCETAMNTH